MQFAALISGGKDSLFSIIHALLNSHDLLCLGHLSSTTEKDSYMFQSTGSNLIKFIAQALDKPLFIQEMGDSLNIEKVYENTFGDEVEQLFMLLERIKRQFPGITALSTGAILSSYQRERIENVCERLGLTCLSYMWMQDQDGLVKDMIGIGMEAVLVKVAALGLNEGDLGKSLEQVMSF
jgi:diphthine-ammonia ligase